MRTRLAHILALPALGLAIGLAAARPARACGGMVFPEHSARVGGMSQQELLVAFTPDQTVLLASAGYKGATGAPAFILPLPAEPTEVVQADPAVFLALDELTAPEVRITVADSGHHGGLCGATAAKSGGDFDDGGGGDVMVLQRGATADYDYVVVGGDTGEAIDAWLTDAGYALPKDYADALAPYVAAGNFIFAAQVKSDAEAGELAPIELHLPPADPAGFAIPFGLAAQSLPPGESLTITTYLLAGGGLAPANYAAAPLDPDAVTAVDDTTSNYPSVYMDAVAAGGWVIDASLGGFDGAELVAGFDAALEAGRATDGTARDQVVGFTDRLGLGDARLTRLRTTLAADALHDMTLKKVTGVDQSRTFAVTYREPVDGCSVGQRRVPLVVLLVPLLLLLRRRR